MRKEHPVTDNTTVWFLAGSTRVGSLTKFCYHVRRVGLWQAMRRAVLKARRLAGVNSSRERVAPVAKEAYSAADEVLNLQPGELVKVKSFEEIQQTLTDACPGYSRHKGLLFMYPMPNFCGKRYRVFKRLNRLLLESTGELKRAKNTVLLEGVVCDGKDFYNCDRSCYHFWNMAQKGQGIDLTAAIGSLLSLPSRTGRAQGEKAFFLLFTLVGKIRILPS